MSRSPRTRSFALGVAIVVALFAIDLAIGSELLLATLYATGALAAAVGAGVRRTLVVAGVAVAFAIVSLAIQSQFEEGQDAVRVVSVVAIGALAVWIARVREDLVARASRAALLARSAEVLGGADGAHETIERVASLPVPAFCDVCAVDLAGENGRVERVALVRAGAAAGREDGAPAPPRDEARIAGVLDTGRPAFELGGRPHMVLPLRARERTLGALTLAQAQSGRRFAPEDVETGLELARRCALFLDNAQLIAQMRETQRRLLEAFGLLDALFERAPIGLAVFDRELRYVRINDSLAEMNGVPAAEHLGRRTADVLPGMGAAVEPALRRVLQDGVPRTDVELRGMTPASPGELRDFVVSYFPVRRGGEVVVGIGAIVLDVTDRRAAERALRAQTRRYETLLQALSEVGEGMVILEGERAVFANQAFQAMTGYDADELSAMGSAFELVPEAVRDVARERAMRRLDDGLADANVQVTIRHREGHPVHLEVAAVPLEIDDRRQLVVLVRDVSARRRAEAERDRLLAGEREARAEAESAHRRARFLAEASAAFDQSLDVQHTAELAATLGVRDDGVTCVIYLVPPSDTDHVAAAAARDPEREAALNVLLARHPVEDRRAAHPLVRVARTGRPIVIGDLGEDEWHGLADDAEQAAQLRALGVRGHLVVPLRARGRTLGAVAFGFAGPLGPDDARERLALLEDFCARAALALDNARLYEERAHVARTLQRSLLPAELPVIPGTELAARYLPAGQGNEVGGDFYDGFALGGDQWALIIGDVCGKGPEAAAITALARYTARASVLHTRRPSRVLGELNEALLRQQLDYRFCTVAFAGLQPLSSGAFAVRLAAGGHPLPLILRADGNVEYAGAPGTLLGIVPEPDLPEREEVLDPGDTLILYTDGVIEASPVDDALGPEAFAGFVAGLAGADADAIAQSIHDVVLGVQDGGLRDDVAVLVLRVLPPA